MCSTIEVLHHRRIFSPQMYDVILVTVYSHMERLTHLTYMLPHLLHVSEYTMLEELQKVRNFTLNNFPVVSLEISLVVFSIGRGLHLDAPHE